MIDQLYDRHYQEGRAHLNAAITGAVGSLISAVRNAFQVLVRIEYNSPWTAKAKRVRCN